MHHGVKLGWYRISSGVGGHCNTAADVLYDANGAVLAMAGQSVHGEVLQRLEAVSGHCPGGEDVHYLATETPNVIRGQLYSGCQLNYEIFSADLAGTACAYNTSNATGCAFQFIDTGITDDVLVPRQGCFLVIVCCWR